MNGLKRTAREIMTPYLHWNCLHDKDGHTVYSFNTLWMRITIPKEISEIISSEQVKQQLEGANWLVLNNLSEFAQNIKIPAAYIPEGKIPDLKNQPHGPNWYCVLRYDKDAEEIICMWPDIIAQETTYDKQYFLCGMLANIDTALIMQFKDMPEEIKMKKIFDLLMENNKGSLSEEKIAEYRKYIDDVLKKTHKNSFLESIDARGRQEGASKTQDARGKGCNSSCATIEEK